VSTGRLSDVDERDVHVRPGKSSRPRTKERPGHTAAVLGTVIAQDRGRYTCLPGPADEPPDASASPVTAVKARELGRSSVVVGDRVRLVGDMSGGRDALARIVGTLPRRTVLRRTADDDDPFERVVVANADQLVVVTALADPPPRPHLIDRCVAAAFDAGLAPLLCLTKADLAPADALLAMYAPLDLDVMVTSRDDPVDVLADRLAGRVSVLVGHSGVGKSTLVNAVIPGAGRSTGVVNAVTGRGRHTSTSAVAIPLPGGGWVVDTPGVRSFGLAHLSPATLIRAFGDLDAATVDCPRGCLHTAASPECALDLWAADGRVEPARVASFRRLLESRDRRDDD
jgi:ribosome biogenesis GTPase